MLTQLVKVLFEKKWTISSCESLTGGMFASKIVDISGASNVFKGSFVTYQDEAKAILLPHAKEILKQDGAISFAMAKEMANVVQNTFQSDISISFTGNAGPMSAENKEVGLVYIAINLFNKQFVYEFHFQGNREEIRNQCLNEGQRLILERIKEIK